MGENTSGELGGERDAGGEGMGENTSGEGGERFSMRLKHIKSDREG